MSNSALDPEERDRQLDTVFDEVEGDHAELSYISAYLGRIGRARTLDDAKELTDRLKGHVDGRMNALKGQLMRMRTPDS